MSTTSDLYGGGTRGLPPQVIGTQLHILPPETEADLIAKATPATLSVSWEPGQDEIVVACSDGHRHSYAVLDLIEFRRDLDETLDRALASGVLLRDNRWPARTDLDDEPEHSS